MLDVRPVPTDDFILMFYRRRAYRRAFCRVRRHAAHRAAMPSFRAIFPRVGLSHTALRLSPHARSAYHRRAYLPYFDNEAPIETRAEEDKMRLRRRATGCRRECRPRYCERRASRASCPARGAAFRERWMRARDTPPLLIAELSIAAIIAMREELRRQYADWPRVSALSPR